MAEAAWRVLDLLLAGERPRPVAEIVTEIGSPVAVADALDTLRAAGLVGRTGALVFVTAADKQRT
jgi:DNA-binding IclR family transcriptional regulator